MTNEIYRQLAENIDAIVWRFDLLNNRWQYVSPQVERILGYHPEECMNSKLWNDLLHPNDQLWVSTFCQNKSKEGKPYNFECRLTHKNKGIVWMNIKIVVELTNNEPAFLTGVMFDISTQKNELEIKNDRSVKLNVDKNRLMSILSHDLKNPFNSILGFLDLLSMNVRNYDISKIETQINIINQSANRYFELLEQLVVWVKAQSDKTSFYPSHLNLHELCEATMKELAIASANKKITIKNHIEETFTITADDIMLRIILRNLVSNAIKYSKDAGQVALNAEKKATFIEISVSDNGVGMEPMFISHLFDLSNMAAKRGTNNEPGLGLGLAICKEFIERHGGGIWVESELGKGTTIKFSILSL